LLLDNKFCDDNIDRQIFGLFDFDEAYNQWNIKTEDVEFVEKDVAKGLVKKRGGRDVYFLLLPISPAHDLADQVVNPKSKAHYKAESRFSIEHFFYGREELKEYFVPDEKRPRSTCVKFSEKRKDTFAKEVVPELPVEAFENFRPTFEFICSKI
jgi:hypothetical protein